MDIWFDTGGFPYNPGNMPHSLDAGIRITACTRTGQYMEAARIRIKETIGNGTGNINTGISVTHASYRWMPAYICVGKVMVLNASVPGISGSIGGVTVTCRRNLRYLDGSEKLDGTDIVNAFYSREEI